MRKGIILAGGPGTRLYPLTSVVSKQLCARGKTTWHTFSSAIIERLKLLSPPDFVTTQKIPLIATADYPLPDPRPQNTLMDTSALIARFGLTLCV